MKRIAQLKQEGHDDEAKALAAPKTRAVSVNFIQIGDDFGSAIVWSNDAGHVAIELRAPGQFAAGAAQRPPSDWTSYNDSYTSDILNTPQLDPGAYEVSSPIEFAQNLRDPLPTNHGLIDNNAMPSDSIRLYQRFIELHKTNFWTSRYPMERHDFEHADAWYDEYRRIHDLLTRFLLRSGGTASARLEP